MAVDPNDTVVKHLKSHHGVILLSGFGPVNTCERSCTRTPHTNRLHEAAIDTNREATNFVLAVDLDDLLIVPLHHLHALIVMLIDEGPHTLQETSVI
jgi:hypothetical protein